MLVIQVIVGVVIADLVSGLFHWFEDGYIHKKMPILGKWFGQVAEDNRLHHSKPRAFLSKSWWQSSADLCLAALLVLAGAAWLKVLNAGVWVFAILVANANQIHKWAHQNPKEKGWLVHSLQKLRILQTPREHGRHHTGEKDTHYCVITNFTNPVLEKMGFWKVLDWVMTKVFGLKRFNETAQ
ncbi:fatty acid desaturase CarF family protein [Parvibium lacunae]|uniref:Lipid desaturase domain-containing protein n=1 Tax=Parvibium lacunae TaxID=1888893 RepID=A0A368L0R2_9BURK|nr:fatty acid desaturase CarF family protein [Parvibium lacunae]RCS57126.1 hypothetical protein DU000_10000 [Parvibium lacunae]